MAGSSRSPFLDWDLAGELREQAADAARIQDAPPGSVTLVIYYADGTEESQVIPAELSYGLDFGEGRQVTGVKVLRRLLPETEQKLKEQDAERKAARGGG